MSIPPAFFLDSPSAEDRVCWSSLQLEGWWFHPVFHPESTQLQVWSGPDQLASTTLFFSRKDVSEHTGLPGDFPTGFRLLLDASRAAQGRDTLELSFKLVGENGATLTLGERNIFGFEGALEKRAYGSTFHPGQSRVLGREDLYGSGPPCPVPQEECLNFIAGLLPAQASILDIGCGVGAYAAGLQARGHRWTGVDLNEFCQEDMARRGLPMVRMTQADHLPFADGKFEFGMCIEVLEHVPQLEVFLKEIRRVVRRRLLVSVPNLEVIPYLESRSLVPWHLLEADHKNFFTRSSLAGALRPFYPRVSVWGYGEIQIKGSSGETLHQHLFAVADAL